MLLRRATLLLLALGAQLQAADVRVLLPDGTRAPGATAAPVTGFLHIKNYSFVKHHGDPPLQVPEDGHITLTGARWIVLHEKGWADTHIAADQTELRLQPWSQMPGRVASPSDANTRVAFSRSEPPRSLKERASVYWTSEAGVDEHGNFLFQHLPDGTGVVGILRELQADRQVQRWRDFPTAVTVPVTVATPLVLGGTGSLVQGRVTQAAAVALRSLTSQPGYSRHGFTTEAGTFTIPGVPPGEYQVVIRSLAGAGEKFHWQREFTLPADQSTFDFGEIAIPETEVEIYEQVEYPDGLIEKIRAAAKAVCPDPISKIWLGQQGAIVTFQPQAKDETHAIARTFTVKIPVETSNKFYPRHDIEGFGFRFYDGEFFEPRLNEQAVRIFPLPSHTFYLKIEDPLDYDTALSLLKAIDSGTVLEKSRRTKNAAGWPVIHSGGPQATRNDLPHIRSLRREKPDGPIKVHTQDRPFGGKSFEFERVQDGFLQISGAGWVS